MFHSGVNWYFGRLSQWSDDFGCGSGVGICDEVYEIRWEAHVRQGGEESVMGDTAKGVLDVQPGNGQWTGLTAGIIHN